MPSTIRVPRPVTVLYLLCPVPLFLVTGSYNWSQLLFQVQQGYMSLKIKGKRRFYRGMHAELSGCADLETKIMHAEFTGGQKIILYTAMSFSTPINDTDFVKIKYCNNYSFNGRYAVVRNNNNFTNNTVLITASENTIIPTLLSGCTLQIKRFVHLPYINGMHRISKFSKGQRGGKLRSKLRTKRLLRWRT